MRLQRKPEASVEASLRDLLLQDIIIEEMAQAMKAAWAVKVA